MNPHRYQIFISSTFRDLADERRAVIELIQSMDHIPAGMEMFGAANDEAWKIIQRVIDLSDYYVLIIGGRYGSTTTEGISFTEKEYDYATSQGIPVIALLHGSPATISLERSELDASARERLEKFRQKIQSRHTTTTWESADGLAGKVAVALSKAFTIHPRTGWIRATVIEETATMLKRIDDLRTERDKLKQEVAELRALSIVDTSQFAQGGDKFTFTFKPGALSPEALYSIAWDDLFVFLAPALLVGAKKSEVAHRICDMVGKTTESDSLQIADGTADRVRNQFIALKWVDVKYEVREIDQSFAGGTIVRFRDEIWVLTDVGKRKFAESQAEKREIAEDKEQPVKISNTG